MQKQRNWIFKNYYCC